MAREVHDVFGQMLTVLKMDLAALSKRLPPGVDDLQERVETISHHVAQLVKMAKHVATTLRPPVLDEAGLAAAMEWQVKEFAARAGMQCSIDIVGVEEEAIGPELATALFRLLQEALTNVARHAHASKIAVSLEQEERQLHFMVKDNGRGIRPEEIASPGSLGLLGMKERIRPFGGEIRITGGPGHGTRIMAAVPLEGPRKGDQDANSAGVSGGQVGESLEL